MVIIYIIFCIISSLLYVFLSSVFTFLSLFNLYEIIYIYIYKIFFWQTFLYFYWKCFCYFASDGYKQRSQSKERAVFSVLESLGIGGLVRNLDVAAIKVGARCLGTGLWYFRISGRLEKWQEGTAFFRKWDR